MQLPFFLQSPYIFPPRSPIIFLSLAVYFRFFFPRSQEKKKEGKREVGKNHLENCFLSSLFFPPFSVLHQNRSPSPRTACRTRTG